MSEFITVQVGQCGNQIGNEFWGLVLQEHGITLKPHKMGPQKTQKNKNLDLMRAFHSFFAVPDTGEPYYRTVADMETAGVKARAVCIDMEDSVVAHFRNGPLRNIFDESCLLTNYPGSGNNWAEGNLSHGRRYSNKIAELLRQSAERCDSLHGFLLVFSLGGGTGSGLGSSLLPLLSDLYPHVDRIATCVYPASNDDVITAPYNTALATEVLTAYADCVFPIDNKALIDICTRLRNCKDSELARRIAMARPFQDMNNLIVQMLLNVTSGSRFPGSLNVDLGEISTNMVPFPGLHYISSGISPLGPLMREDELFSSVWSKENQLLKVNPMSGIVIASLLLGRGDIYLADMCTNIDRYQKKIKVAPWGKDAMKVGLCSIPPAGQSASLLGLFNTSSMGGLFQNILTQFNKLFTKKAHTHHYLNVDGFDESYFISSLESLRNTIADYNQIPYGGGEQLPRLNVL